MKTAPPHSVFSSALLGLAALTLALLLILCLRPRDVKTLKPPAPIADLPSPQAVWPWPGATRDEPHAGVTHWLDRSASDRTELDLLQFDFTANPRLRLELYDQDEDDPVPLDNGNDYWKMGVGAAARHLNETGRGTVVAAWNGTFFGYDHRSGRPHGIARHVGPVVLRGKVRYNVGNHRWTFGVRHGSHGPTFAVFHLPDRAMLEREFAYAASGVQCLVREGQPLRLQPFPRPGEPPPPSPVPSTPEEAGHIPWVDHMKTSRTSLGWSRDGRRLWLLIASEPDHETASKAALRAGEVGTGGWTLADLQRFWLARKAWGAVNLDGGGSTQMTYLRAGDMYELVPPRQAAPQRRLSFPPTFAGAPQGGALMYLYVRDPGEVAPY
jgi:hypothetical protein